MARQPGREPHQVREHVLVRQQVPRAVDAEGRVGLAGVEEEVRQGHIVGAHVRQPQHERPVGRRRQLVDQRHRRVEGVSEPGGRGAQPVQQVLPTDEPGAHPVRIRGPDVVGVEHTHLHVGGQGRVAGDERRGGFDVATVAEQGPALDAADDPEVAVLGGVRHAQGANALNRRPVDLARVGDAQHVWRVAVSHAPASFARRLMPRGSQAASAP